MNTTFSPLLVEKLRGIVTEKFNLYADELDKASAKTETQWLRAYDIYEKLKKNTKDKETQSDLLTLLDQVGNVACCESEDAYLRGFLEGMLYLQKLNFIQDSLVETIKTEGGQAHV